MWDVRNGFDSKPCAVQLSEGSTKTSTFQEKLLGGFQKFLDSLVGGVPNAGDGDGDKDSDGNEGNSTSNSTNTINMGHLATTAAAAAVPQTAKTNTMKFTIA